MPQGDIRFGLVGFGAWGQYHANAIEKTPGARLVAIAVPSQRSMAAARAAHPRCTVMSDFAQLVARDDINVVDIVTPSNLHVDIGRAAIAAGKHVLMEKPMATDVAGCRALVESARDADRLLAVGFELRLSELWGKAKALIDSGAVGEPKYCLIELWRNPYRQGASGWRYDIDRVGNWVLEEPIHFFDLARWYLSSAGEPVSVSARANSIQAGHPELTDNFSALVDFPDGAYAVISQTLSAFEHHQVAKLTGTRGAIWASWRGALARDHHPKFSLKHFDGETVHDIALENPAGEVYELEYEIRMVVDAIRGRRRLAASGDDGLWSVALCEAAQQSIERGARVAVADVM